MDRFERAARQAIYIFAMDDATILENAFPGFDEYHVGEARRVRYTLITDHTNREYQIALRGSENEQNWLDNFTPEFVWDDEIKATIHWGYRDISNAILEQLEPMLTHRDYRITVSGGSLGGVNSVLVGWYLDTRGYDVAQIYNFAGPRLTDDDYSHLNVMTVSNILDAVCMLPLATLRHRYRHQGVRVVITPAEENYKENRGGAVWRFYDDCLLTDFLMSSYGIYRKLDPAEHLAYGEYMLYLVGKEDELANF
ncbi:MAG: hypothetical protein OEZ16_04895 [Chromatiales bacterium]|nr:hypothetical protein [Chromatiales bacterium]